MREVLALVAVVLLTPVSTHAQAVSNSFPDLRRTLITGESVIVTDTSGHDTRGRVAEVSESALVILVPEKRLFPEAVVTSIRRTDSLWSGAWKGTAVGGAVLGFGVYDCVLGSGGGTCGAPVEDGALFYWLAPAAGFVLGALIDKAVGNEPIYAAPNVRPSAIVSPLLGRRVGGVSLALRF